MVVSLLCQLQLFVHTQLRPCGESRLRLGALVYVHITNQPNQLLFDCQKLLSQFVSLGGVFLVDLAELLKVLQLVQNELSLVENCDLMGLSIVGEAPRIELDLALLPLVVVELVEEDIECAHESVSVFNGNL